MGMAGILDVGVDTWIKIFVIEYEKRYEDFKFINE